MYVDVIVAEMMFCLCLCFVVNESAYYTCEWISAPIV